MMLSEDKIRNKDIANPGRNCFCAREPRHCPIQTRKFDTVYSVRSSPIQLERRWRDFT